MIYTPLLFWHSSQDLGLGHWVFATSSKTSGHINSAYSRGPLDPWRAPRFHGLMRVFVSFGGEPWVASTTLWPCKQIFTYGTKRDNCKSTWCIFCLFGRTCHSIFLPLHCCCCCSLSLLCFLKRFKDEQALLSMRSHLKLSLCFLSLGKPIHLGKLFKTQSLPS